PMYRPFLDFFGAASPVVAAAPASGTGALIVGGAAGAAGVAGTCSFPVAGTEIALEHLGHFTIFPADWSGTFNFVWHDGQVTTIGMTGHPNAERGPRKERGHGFNCS